MVTEAQAVGDIRFDLRRSGRRRSERYDALLLSPGRYVKVKGLRAHDTVT